MKRKGHPESVGKYLIDGILGHGGMATVYRAIEPESGRTIALKLLNPSEPLAQLMDAEKLQELFSAEFGIMSRLRHPNIAEVIDYDVADERPFYTMEYFCNNLGMMLGEKFIVEEKSRLIPAEKAIDYAGQILNGLARMHRAGIIHRDIKPYNMMVTDRDQVKICDFGMSRQEDEESFQVEGINIGSPYYTAPEQIRNPDQADARSDIYSMAVLLYRMLTGELPMMKGFMLSRVNLLYDQSWDSFFSKALSWKPDLRFAGALEMSAALKELRLHREREEGSACRQPASPASTVEKLSLRTGPVRVSGQNARDVFGLDSLWQPLSYVRNSFRQVEDDLILDEVTGLVWQRSPSDVPLDREAADDYIASLNVTGRHGITTWRLPTVNELLTLAEDPAQPRHDCPAFLAESTGWFWSSDRRSPKTSWYANIGLCYVGWQHDSCSYLVRAVTSMPLKRK